MPHARQQIRDAAVAALTGLATTGTRVFNARAERFAEAELPSLNVLTPEEELVGESMGLRHDRELRIHVEIRVKHESTYAATADTSAMEVEQALMADPSLGGRLKRLVPARTRTEISAETDREVAVVTIEWAAQYRVVASAPQTIIQ